MTGTAPDGTFYLGPGVRLCPGKEESGLLIQPDPLRAIRVNPSARRLLERCRTGVPASAIAGNPDVLAFFDSLCQARLLDWRPRTRSEGGETPFVSIIVPVYNRADDIGECLSSLLGLDYPDTRREIIVADDGSTDETAERVRDYPVRLLRLRRNGGQSKARNRAVEIAEGDIIGFIDSDCIADPRWLTELTPYFQDARVALIGGYVDAYYHRTRLDRFESAGSPLNMGDETLIGAGDKSVLYVPTCNMLVRRSAYRAVGGLDAALRVGEDVDLCWRMLGAGHRLMYVPKGRVAHKHRNRFWPGFLRRFDYGVSEPALYAVHARAAKRFPWQTGGLLFLTLTGSGFIFAPSVFFSAAGAVLLIEAALRKRGMERACGAAVPVRYREFLRAALRSHLMLAFYLSHHLNRYYLLPLLLLSILRPRFAPFLAGLILFPTLVSFLRKRPRTDPVSYGFFFTMEQLFYGAGVLWGSIRHRHLKCYGIAFANAGFLKRSPAQAMCRLKFRLGSWMERPKWIPFRSNSKT
jgi:mycofactocin system glycosyltransferase